MSRVCVYVCLCVRLCVYVRTRGCVRVCVAEMHVFVRSIGNITGSNSVNVFLGLGLPWCIASIYWVSE